MLASSCLSAISKQLNALTGKFNTIYVGGGTPTALDTDLLEKLINSVKKHLSGKTEFTVEANPESVTGEKLSVLLDGGVNRLSIGAQSFDDGKLRALGRIHDSLTAKNSILLAEKKGFKNVGLDLIFGSPGETADCWKKDLEKAVSLPVTHISCYGLTYEKGTPFLKSVKAGALAPLEEEKTAGMYEFAVSYLPAKGFEQYEISNFSKKSFRSRHNQSYWNNDPYTGLGPSAVSYTDGSREENVHDVIDYVKRVDSGASPAASREKLLPPAGAKETAALKIRTMDGIDFGWFKEKTRFDFLELEKGAVGKLIEDGLIEYIKDAGVLKGVRLARRGLLFCDIVSSAFL